MSISPAARRSSVSRRARPRVSRPVSSASLKPAASAKRRMRSKCWRARISVGAISAACRPASTTLAMASSATIVLPEPTSPCSSRSMRLSEREIGADFGERASSARRSGERAAPRRSFRAMRPSPVLARPAGRRICARISIRASWLGEQFVIGEPHARRAPRARSPRASADDAARCSAAAKDGSSRASRTAGSSHSGSVGQRAPAPPRPPSAPTRWRRALRSGR